MTPQEASRQIAQAQVDYQKVVHPALSSKNELIQRIEGLHGDATRSRELIESLRTTTLNTFTDGFAA